MSEHRARISWKRISADFSYENYNREHSWSFPGGGSIQASAAPQYKGDPACVDPEEALVAAISSCHMLTFLAIAAKKNLLVESYQDEAVGYLEKDGTGKLSITRVTLRPDVKFSEEQEPEREALAAMHEKAHHNCFIANSVKTRITIEF